MGSSSPHLGVRLASPDGAKWYPFLHDSNRVGVGQSWSLSICAGSIRQTLRATYPLSLLVRVVSSLPSSVERRRKLTSVVRCVDPMTAALASLQELIVELGDSKESRTSTTHMSLLSCDFTVDS